jgi:hypothetical protein
LKSVKNSILIKKDKIIKDEIFNFEYNRVIEKNITRTNINLAIPVILGTC